MSIENGREFCSHIMKWIIYLCNCGKLWKKSFFVRIFPWLNWRFCTEYGEMCKKWYLQKPKNLLKLRTSGKHKNKHHEKQKDRQGRLAIRIKWKRQFTLLTNRLIFKSLHYTRTKVRDFCSSTFTRFESGHLGVSDAFRIRETEFNRYLS